MVGKRGDRRRRRRRQSATSFLNGKLVDIPQDSTQHCYHYHQHETKPIKRIDSSRLSRPMGAVSKTFTFEAFHYLHLAVCLLALAGGRLVAGLNLDPGHYMDHQPQRQHQHHRQHQYQQQQQQQQQQNSWPMLQQQQRRQESWQIEEVGQPAARHHHHHQQEAVPGYWMSRERAEEADEQSAVGGSQFHEHLIGAQHHFQQPYPSNDRHQQGVDGSRASTAPTISRQVMAPPPFHELGLAPTNVLQVETSSSNPNNHDNLKPAASENFVHLNEIQSERVLGARSLNYRQHQEPLYSNQVHGKPAPIGAFELDEMMKEAGGGQQQQQIQPQQHQLQKAQDMSNKVSQEDGTEAKSSQLDGGQSVEAEKSDLSVGGGQVEPRQRRRIFNRILKKAEWNHLFVELSKVFLRYFLDLALKDIIGKQAGGTGASDSTTSRKKLDAQSELTDLLKDFVKTAISNI